MKKVKTGRKALGADNAPSPPSKMCERDKALLGKGNVTQAQRFRLMAYKQGRQVKERVQSTGRGKSSEICAQVAQKHNLTVKEVKANLKFVNAIDAIVERCGEHARQVLLGGEHELTVKEIEKLSRKAPPMQRAQVASLYKTGRARKWPTYSTLVRKAFTSMVPTERLAAPSTRLPPVETWDYDEVIDRLRRFAGVIAKCVIDVPRLEPAPTPEEISSILDHLDFSARCVDLLRACLAARNHSPECGPAQNGGPK